MQPMGLDIYTVDTQHKHTFRQNVHIVFATECMPILSAAA